VNQLRLIEDFDMLVLFCSQLGHDAIYDLVGDAFRQFERTTFGHDFYSLAAGIVQNVASTALGQVQFELFTDLWQDAILKVISELS
jgi:hypothetical protein